MSPQLHEAEDCNGPPSLIVLLSLLAASSLLAPSPSWPLLYPSPSYILAPPISWPLPSPGFSYILARSLSWPFLYLGPFPLLPLPSPGPSCNLTPPISCSSFLASNPFLPPVPPPSPLSVWPQSR